MKSYRYYFHPVDLERGLVIIYVTAHRDRDYRNIRISGIHQRLFYQGNIVAGTALSSRLGDGYGYF